MDAPIPNSWNPDANAWGIEGLRAIFLDKENVVAEVPVLGTTATITASQDCELDHYALTTPLGSTAALPLDWGPISLREGNSLVLDLRNMAIEC